MVGESPPFQLLDCLSLVNKMFANLLNKIFPNLLNKVFK
nr:MAG TPA_asm: hypothetical protein [Caudoviricetes sp.]